MIARIEADLPPKKESSYNVSLEGQQRGVIKKVRSILRLKARRETVT